MTPNEHYHEAERLLSIAKVPRWNLTSAAIDSVKHLPTTADVLAAAMVHARLATASDERDQP
ncbi:hypothetical protein [Kutzneria albida]|uniref:Uncharacterized protein n=1 Tax=Kutzneria albida DSM 43870 TaxID=1449976 RepID=W5WBX2_9PSEU|nr:hypothetical protein [Kutzneria albida]AHH98250.1 hypothetical protein KALB_4888 [Kutzneria albida DSM 43870]